MGSFLDRIDHNRIVAAIAGTEKKTSAEIRVHLHHRRVGDVMAVARRTFEKMGMTHTPLRNGILIFIAPRSKKFAILGDTGIHERCGDGFWAAAAEKLSAHFRGERFTEGLVEAIAGLGDELGKHFPPETTPHNHLPDEIHES